jgi:hypothetical protein
VSERASTVRYAHRVKYPVRYSLHDVSDRETLAVELSTVRASVARLTREWWRVGSYARVKGRRGVLAMSPDQYASQAAQMLVHDTCTTSFTDT